jgi:hypothetical protein
VPYGPCDVYGYRRGVVPPDGCESGYHTCPLAADAIQTGEVCACPCPDPVPEGGVVTTKPECVTPANQSPCGATQNDEVVLLYQTGGWVSTGCDYVTTTRLVTERAHDATGELQCMYDPNGVLVHATRIDPPNSGCPGVTAWTTGTPPLVECPPTRCWRGAGPAPDDSPRCTQ